MIDTSEVSSSDGGAFSDNFGREDKSEHKSAESTEPTEADAKSGKGSSEHSGRQAALAKMEDPFFKIKMHSMLSLQILFRVCNKAFNIGGLWHPIFPHFLIHPRPEILS
jgi:hypothetical protein